jgi:hypothetical protein
VEGLVNSRSSESNAGGINAAREYSKQERSRGEEPYEERCLEE